MNNDFSIKSISSRKRKEAMQAMGSAHAAGAAAQPQAVQAGQQQQAAQKGDSVQLSDEIKQTQNVSRVGNVDNLKNEINGIQEQLKVKPSGQDASSGLVNDVMSVQMEKNGLQAAQPHAGQKLGMDPGMHNGGVSGVNGIQSGMEKGMKVGGAFSSRYSSQTGHQPGGGTATPKMVKLQTDYAGAMKAGHGINPQVNNMVMNTFADSGKTANPIRSMLGVQKNQV